MPELRPIKPEELNILSFLLEKINKKLSDYPAIDLVDDYENAAMRSIGIGNAELATFDGDLVQAHYTDTDGVAVIITLTKDTDNQLLDLDFWKEDFTKLLRYPLPKDLIFYDK
jgi:hypothetical protein